MTIAVLDYGMGNLRSVARAVEHVGGRPLVTEDADAALAAGGLVVPGVGHFGACMLELRGRGLDSVVKAFVDSGKPVFGVCVGMQVLLEGSEEAPDVPGLGVLEGVSRRLPDTVKVPHMGWNVVRWEGDHAYLSDVPQTWFYFVHSFAPVLTTPGIVGMAVHGEPFAAALAEGNVFATQFHPEKSGHSGLELYRAFVRGATG